MNNDNESKLHDLLMGLAEAPPAPDEAAAWAAITAGIEEDHASRRRARWTVGIGGTLLAGAAAAALVVLVGASDDRQSVDVIPPATQGVAPATLPAHPVVRVSPDFTQLQVWDADTGTLVATPVTLEPNQFIYSPSMTDDGTIYFGFSDPETSRSEVRTTRWDGDGATVTVPIPELGEGVTAGFAAISGDGTTIALELLLPDSSPAGFAGGLALYDVASGEVRTLQFDAEEASRRMGQPQDMEFSPDGTQLLFVNAHDNDGTEGFESFVLDVSATSLSEARYLTTQEVREVAWGPDGGIVVKILGASLAYVEGGPDVGLPPIDDVSFVTLSRGVLYATTGDNHVWRLDTAADRWVDTGIR